jgi:hypothetical protein
MNLTNIRASYGRRVLFLNPRLRIVCGSAAAGNRVGDDRRAWSLAHLAYNVLIPIRSVAAKSNQPAAKSIRITLCPADSGEVLHFSKAVLARNLDRAVPRVP